MKYRFAIVGLFAISFGAAQDLNDDLEKATKNAVRAVAPSVVQIVTQGGIDMVVTSPKGPVFRKSLGPLVIYELTPLDQPRVSDYLYLAEVPTK